MAISHNNQPGYGVQPAYAPSTYGDMAQQAADPRYQRQVIEYHGGEPPGTIIIDTPHFFLYLVLDDGRALRYGIGVGRPGFTSGGREVDLGEARVAGLASAGRDAGAAARFAALHAGRPR